MMMITLMMITYMLRGVLDLIEGRKNHAFAKKSKPNEILVRVTRDIEFGG